MAETYIPYGEEQIEYAPLVKNMADDVVNYVDQQPWSAKRKNRFMEAYSDIVSNGIIGADNKSGQWAVNLRGNIDTNSMSKKDRDIYQEAAYYILQKMKGAPVKKDTEKEDKKNLQLYDNDWHQKAITGYIGNNMFGGQNWDYTTQWDTLDKRDEKTGLLGTSNRMAKLANMLEGYGNSLEEGKYNFEGTAFKDLNDLKSRINDAVTALRGGVLDQNVIDALNRVGIDYRTYLHDGSDEQITLQDGTTVTRGQYLKALQEQEAAANQQKLLEQKQQDIAKQKASLGVLDLVSGVHAVEAKTNPDGYSNRLAQIYGVGEKGFNAINQRVQMLLNKGKGLTSKDKKELGNLLYYIRANNPNYQKSNITDQEWAELNIHKNLGSNNRAGFVRLPWQSNGRYTFADDKGNVYFLKPQKHQKLAAPIQRSNISNYRKNFLEGTSVMNTQEREKYLKSSKNGLTSAEWEELASIGLDIASIVDPEMFSAAGLALAGSGLRHHATASQPGGMSTSDKWWQAADYGLSLLGSIPVLGDSALAWRALNNLRKAIKPLGIIMAGANVPQAAKAAYNKVVNGQDLTIQDWRAIGAVLTAAVGIGRGRQMSKRAEALRRTGGNTTKTTKEGVIKTSEGKIKVDEATAKQLKTQFKGADGATRTQKLRENVKVKEAAKQQGIDLSKAEVKGHGIFKRSPISSTTSTSTTSGNRVATLRAMSEFNKNHGWLARKGLAEQDWIFRHTGGYESTPTSNWFKDIWNNLRKSKWDDFGNRNNTVNNGNSHNTVNNGNSQQQNVTKRETPLTESEANTLKNNVKSWRQEYKDILNINKNKGRSYEWGKNDVRTNPDRLKSEIKLGNKELKFEISSDGELLVNGEKTSINAFGKSGKREARKKIREVILKTSKEQRLKRNTKEFEKMIQELRKIKSAGFLLKGGTIQKDSYTLISEFLNKQK